MNGAKLPNWVYLVVMGIMLGIQGSAIFFAQSIKLDHLASESDVHTKQLAELTQEVRNTNDYLEETITQANSQHRQMWEALGKPQKARDLPTRREWERRHWEWEK